MVDFMTKLADIIEELCPSGYVGVEKRDRPYSGQPHTDLGERGKTEIKGITFRDLHDCFVRACYHSSGLTRDDWPDSLYKLPWDEMDPIAIQQNMSCEVEKLMGIYPNVPELRPV